MAKRGSSLEVTAAEQLLNFTQWLNVQSWWYWPWSGSKFVFWSAEWISIGHFLLLVLWNGVSKSSRFRDIVL